jgi:hypothetical protein
MTNNALHVRLRYLRNAEAVLALALPGALAWHWWRSGAAVDWALHSHEPLPAYFRPLYRSFRAVDLMALIVMTIWLAVMALRGADFNYLRRHRRLRRAALATDLGRRQR